MSRDKDEKFMTYQKYVELGRCAVQSIELFQLKLARYAIRACEIRHGGISKGLYTLKDYAKDVGVPYKRLSSWTLIYRNVIEKLGRDINKLDMNDWKAASKVYRALKVQQALHHAQAGRLKKKGYGKQLSEQIIRDSFNAYRNGSIPANARVDIWTEYIIKCRSEFTKSDPSQTTTVSLKALKHHMDKFSSVVTEELIKRGEI